MRVTLIGSSNVSSGLATQISRAAHSLVIAESDPANAKEPAHTVNAGAKANAAAEGADVVIVATAYADAVAALDAVGDLNGKVIVDITIPFAEDCAEMKIGASTSGAEEIQRAFPGAKVVKAFNAILAQALAAGRKFAGANVPVYVAGDDAGAKETVKSLIQSTGFAPRDAGRLKNMRYLEPIAGLNIFLSYGARRDTTIAPAWVGVQ